MNPEQAEILRAAGESLKSGNDEVVMDAISSLADANIPEAVAEIVTCLGSDNERVRMAAVRAIGTLNPADSVERITAHLQQEDNPYVRATAAVALGSTGKMKALTALAGLLRDDDARVRANAVEAVTHLGDPLAVKMLTPLLDDSSNRVKTNVAMALWKFGGLRMISYLENMLNAGQDKWDKASAAYALGEIGGFQAMSTLLTSLYDRNPEVKRNVIRSLGKVGDGQMSRRLLRFMEDKDPLIRANTLEAVGFLAGEQHLDTIVARLLDEDDETVLQRAAAVIDHLVKNASQPGIEKLRKLLSAGNEAVKLALLKSFERYGASWQPVFKVEIIMDLNNLIDTDSSGRVKRSARKAVRGIRKRG